MTNLLDDIFRRKLEHLQTPPAPRAWEQIEKGMRRKRMTPWLAIAASLLLAIAAFALLLTRQTDGDTPQIAERQPPETQETQTSNNDEVAAPPERSIDTLAEDAQARDARPVLGVPDAQVEVASESVAGDTRSQEAEPSSPIESDPAIDAGQPTEDTVPTTFATVPAQDDTSPVKIVLDADDVQSKYLKRKNNDDATEEVAKASGLKKLLDKAEQIQDQDPIGDLRQMKNEILALNFQGKKREQHK